MIAYETVVDAVRRLCLDTLFCMREDIRFALEQAHEKESQPAKQYISLLLENEVLAQKERIPLHHDPGVPGFFVELGKDTNVDAFLRAAIDEGVKQSAQEHPVRPQNLQNPFVPESATADTTPSAVHVDIVEGDELKITCVRNLASGELSSRVTFLVPPYSEEDVESFVIESVRQAGVIPEPPVVIGVAVGSSLQNVVGIAKKALLRPVGKPHHVLEHAQFEQELLQSINELGIGPGGLGGLHTALAVHVEVAPSHEEAVPLAVVIQGATLRARQMIIRASVEEEEEELNEGVE
ncbi:MAG: fumarate hydratase [Deltaproteobacteria bacterium]|nr:fumarate hydratase [Deltaproteobacteria bacterium]MBU51300.1 fumarate hydratase [Deltaproteobacteria bacterium]|tara:strand:- start:5192 stop:6073 length:882 start_codon:yes stop_codon:yes gene_type:complete